MHNNHYAASGAAGCESRSAGAAGLRFRRFRRALPPLAAAAVLLFAGGPAARAQSISPADKCAADGKMVTCTGDLSGGVHVDGGDGTYTRINIHGLTRDIAPAENTDGIELIASGSASAIAIVIDTGGFDIVTEGDAEGIYALTGGDLDITVLADDIATNGDAAYGIIAQSQSGDVKVMVTGDIATRGRLSDGIAVTSFGALTIEMAGDIATASNDSRGIYANSANGDIGITLRGGTVASDLSAGIEFEGGATNRLTSYNEVTISGGTFDVLGVAGDETIDNYGILTSGTFTDGALTHGGTIDLGVGSNAFDNRAGATFNSGAAVVLGGGNTFTNAGDLSPGGADAVLTTALTGDFRNFMTDDQGVREYGVFTVTIGPNNSSDKLTVTGTAELGGTVRIVGSHEGAFSPKLPVLK